MAEERSGGWWRASAIGGIVLLLVYVFCPMVLLFPLTPFYGRDLRQMPPTLQNVLCGVFAPQRFLHDHVAWYARMIEYESAMVGIG
jgi:hypothetical protein